MHPVSAAGYRDVGARIDEQASLPLFSFERRIFADNTNRRAGKNFKLANGKIFLAQLNEVHTATSRLRDLRKQSALASAFIPGELDAICDVEKDQAFKDWSLRFREPARPVRLYASVPVRGGTWSDHRAETRNPLPANPRS